MLGRDSEVDRDVVDRWNSFRYRKMFGITHEQYLNTPALVVDWDLALAEVEAQVERELQEG